MAKINKEKNKKNNSPDRYRNKLVPQKRKIRGLLI
jgi:hypothetical protein